MVIWSVGVGRRLSVTLFNSSQSFSLSYRTSWQIIIIAAAGYYDWIETYLNYLSNYGTVVELIVIYIRFHTVLTLVDECGTFRNHMTTTQILLT